jgi:DNA-binding MarR family transcriptional regulator
MVSAQELGPIAPPMAKFRSDSTLYRLIEVGQLVHRTLTGPLRDRGLEPGDDALLFVLHEQLGATEAHLAAALGLDSGGLETRTRRLLDRQLIEQRAIGPELTPGFALTEAGERLRKLLAETWEELEGALLGDLKPKRRKAIRKSLGRFAALLQL